MSHQVVHRGIPFPFLQGGGELGRLTRAFDWSLTSVGSPEHWSQSLRTTVALILACKSPMFLWWGDDLIQFYNDAYRPSLGNEGKHPLALGQKGMDCWPEIWEIIFPLIKQVKATGEATWSEDQLIPIYRNGKIEDVYWTFGYSAVLGESGSIEGVLVVCSETTQKVNTIKQLIESEKRFQNLVRDAAVGIIVLIGERCIVKIVNRAYARLIDRRVDDLLGLPLFDIIPEAAPYFEHLLSGVRETGLPVFLENHPYFVQIHGEKKEGYLNIVYQPYKDEEGSIRGVMALVQDVTSQVSARQKIEEIVAERTKELAASNADLEKSNAELEQFAYIASHDLQEPLRKLSTFTEMLETSLGEVNPQSRHYMARINDSVARMINLVKDILIYSKLNKELVAFSAVDLNEIVESVSNDFELTGEHTRGLLRHDVLPVIQGNTLQMTQLFSNLLSNALKFTRVGVKPVIEIVVSKAIPKAFTEVREGPSYCYIQVRDNGIGFHPQHAEKIFQIFHRLHGKREYGGTGIGLALCKQICLNHQGNIFATAEEQSGAVFHIILPMTQPA